METYNLVMEAKGTMRKLVLAIMAVVLIQPAAFGTGLGEKSKYVTSLVWEKAVNNPRVLAEMDGKALVLFEGEKPHHNNIELIDLETGKNLWDGVETDIGGYIKQKLPYFRWVFLKDLGLIYFKTDYSNSMVSCFQLLDGSKVWQSPDGQDWPLPRCIENGIAYGFGSTGNFQKGTQFIVGYDLKTGIETSRVVTNNGIGGYYVNVFGKSGDIIYYSESGYVFSINLKTLERKILIRDDGFAEANDSDYVFLEGKIIARTGVYDDKCKLLDKIVCYDTSINKTIWSYNGLNNFIVVGKNVVFTSYEADCITPSKFFTAFVEVRTGKLINKIYNRSNYFTIYNTDGNSIAAINYAGNSYTKLTIYDTIGNILLLDDISDFYYFNYESPFFYSGNKFILPSSSNYIINKNWSTLQCYEIIEESTSEVILRNELSIEGYKLIDIKKNLTFLTKVDNDGNIEDLSVADIMADKDILPNDSTPLEKALLGRSLEKLEYSFNDNELFTTIFDGSKRTALGCFDVLTGKQIWKSEKLKDCTPPTLYPFVSSCNGKEGDVFELDKRYGWTIKHYVLKNQSKPFSIVGMNELAMVSFDGQYSMYYYKNGSRGWISKDALPKGVNPQNSLLTNNVFVSPVAEGNLAKLVGKDVFSGKVLWSVPIDKVYARELDKIVALTKSKTGTTEIAIIDFATGKILDSKPIPEDLFDGYTIKEVSVKNMIVTVYLEKPNKGSLVLVFDKGLEFLCKKEFDKQYISKFVAGIGRVALTLEKPQYKSIETIVMRLARVKTN